ncbi:hypothetical protein SMRU11_00695 (plasmid) [Sinorhizobium meliloti RU11/001]|nr:hypothetical protein SMRU11_00695 [Sinorhizobium meliloti RU11/001]
MACFYSAVDSEDSEGESVSPSHTISAVADLFTIARPVLDPQFEQINEPNVFGMRIKGFAVRIERSKPKIFVPEMER